MTKLKEHKPSKIEALKAMTPADRRRAIFDGIMNNAMFIIIALVIIYVAIKNPRFLSIPSLVNIISLTAAKLPIALVTGDTSGLCRRLYHSGRYRYFRGPSGGSGSLYLRRSAADHQ